MKPILYSYWRSSCSWRVRIVLELKNVDYEYRAIHLVRDGGQQRTSEYGEINPLNQVPAFVFNDVTLTQSMAIIEYLEAIFPEVKLLPYEPIKKAKVREICEVINAGTQPLQNSSVMNKHSDIQGERIAWSHFWINKGLIAVEVLVSKSAGKYCVGDQVTMADCYLVPQVYNANRYKVDMKQFPNINTIVQNLEKVKAFITTHPENQPDKQ